MDVIVLYLWTKFRTIPFFTVLLGILHSDSDLQGRHASHFPVVLQSISCFTDTPYIFNVLSEEKVQDTQYNLFPQLKEC